jgi:molybdopterin molybdotransferase
MSTPMITLEQAYQTIDTVAEQVKSTTEQLPVTDALNRVLAKPQTAKLELPPFNKAAMDGFAITQNDQQDSYKITEVIAAGQMPTIALTPGHAAQIMTGAPVPENTYQVVPIEYTQQQNNQVKILQYPNAQHICQQGEDVKPGTTIANAGDLLTPTLIANLISCGIDTAEVYAKPKIAILSTGNEIVESINEIANGKIIDANRPMLKALCQKNDYQINYSNKICDDLAKTKSILSEALDKADIIILSGGVSMGEFDFVGTAINELGFKTHFNRIAIKPGKPTTFASKGDKIIFGLPGNPVAVCLTFNLFVKRIIAKIQNQKIEPPYMLPLTKTYKRKKTERAAFIPCKITRHGELEPIEYHGSAHLLALSDADGFFMIEQNVQQINAGEKVSVIKI